MPENSIKSGKKVFCNIQNLKNSEKIVLEDIIATVIVYIKSSLYNYHKCYTYLVERGGGIISFPTSLFLYLIGFFLA